MESKEIFEKTMKRIRPHFSLSMNKDKTYYLDPRTGNMWEAWERGRESLFKEVIQ